MIQRNRFQEDQTLPEINISCLRPCNPYSRILEATCFLQITEMTQSDAAIRAALGLWLFM